MLRNPSLVKLFLGIDGGGTSTRAILVNSEGRIFGEGLAGPSNYHNVGPAAAVGAWRKAAEKAWSQLNRPYTTPAATFIGSAGIKAAVDIARLTSLAESAGLGPAGAVTIANDLQNALAGGLDGRPGIALIAGTGTNCFGRNPSGRTFMCGGWGWLLDDQGGGVGLGLAGLRTAVRAADGRGPTTSLLPAMLAFYGLAEANEILERLYVRSCSAEDVAAFAPVVTRAAADGDASALAVLHAGAKALAELVVGAVQALDFVKPPEVVLLGGCVRSGAPYQPLVETEIRTAVEGVRLVEPVGPPVHGAAFNVLQAAGLPRPARLDFSRLPPQSP